MQWVTGRIIRYILNQACSEFHSISSKYSARKDGGKTVSIVVNTVRSATRPVNTTRKEQIKMSTVNKAYKQNACDKVNSPGRTNSPNCINLGHWPVRRANSIVKTLQYQVHHTLLYSWTNEDHFSNTSMWMSMSIGGEGGGR